MKSFNIQRPPSDRNLSQALKCFVIICERSWKPMLPMIRYVQHVSQEWEHVCRVDALDSSKSKHTVYCKIKWPFLSIKNHLAMIHLQRLLLTCQHFPTLIILIGEWQIHFKSDEAKQHLIKREEIKNLCKLQRYFEINCSCHSKSAHQQANPFFAFSK